jgi:hypothetical protein
VSIPENYKGAPIALLKVKLGVIFRNGGRGEGSIKTLLAIK